jgi:hypothetical protein
MAIPYFGGSGVGRIRMVLMDPVYLIGFQPLVKMLNVCAPFREKTLVNVFSTGTLNFW